MKKLRFNNGSDAVSRSAENAELRGCDMILVNMIWGVRNDEIGFYLEIPEEDLEYLTEEEMERLE